MNDLKYELMVLHQDLSKVVPSSKLAEEILAKSSEIQAQISKLEAELSSKPEIKAENQQAGSVKKLQEEDGQVRIWSSSSST